MIEKLIKPISVEEITEEKRGVSFEEKPSCKLSSLDSSDKEANAYIDPV